MDAKIAQISSWAKNCQPCPQTWSGIPGRKHSAVLCLIAEKTSQPGDFFLLVTKRSLKVRTHKGQIGFAGGHREASDKNPTETALRETFEELGIPPKKVKVFGALPFEKSIHNNLVIPIYGYCRIDPHSLRISHDEVSRVIFFPMEKVWRGLEKSVQFRLFGVKRQSYIYQHQGDVIWGLTAKIIYNAYFSDLLNLASTASDE